MQIKEVFLILIRVLMAFILPLLLFMGTIIFYLGHFGYSSIAGGPLVSIICGAMIIMGSILFIVIALYDYQKIVHENKKGTDGAARSKFI